MTAPTVDIAGYPASLEKIRGVLYWSYWQAHQRCERVGKAYKDGWRSLEAQDSAPLIIGSSFGALVEGYHNGKASPPDIARPLTPQEEKWVNTGFDLYRDTFPQEFPIVKKSLSEYFFSHGVLGVRADG